MRARILTHLRAERSLVVHLILLKCSAGQAVDWPRSVDATMSRNMNRHRHHVAGAPTISRTSYVVIAGERTVNGATAMEIGDRTIRETCPDLQSVNDIANLVMSGTCPAVVTEESIVKPRVGSASVQTDHHHGLLCHLVDIGSDTTQLAQKSGDSIKQKRENAYYPTGEDTWVLLREL
jgi:hypothetical protein